MHASPDPATRTPSSPPLSARSAWRRWWQDEALRVQPSFLPDFCDVRVAFMVILAAELLALVLTLAPPASGNLWLRLGLTSLFVQWVAVSSAALLCKLRPWLARRPVFWAATISYALILAVTALFSLLSAPLNDTQPFGRSMLLNNLAIAGIIAAVLLRYFYLQQEYRNRIRSAAEARVAALQARIHPHFLFNSMNTIASLTRSDPARAEQAIEDLSELFRASLGVRDTLVPLAEEMALCERYLAIEQLRLGARLRVHWQCSEAARDFRLPLLSLQPLVENAVYHGIQPRPEGGEVRIDARIEAGNLLISVDNPLPAPGRSRAGHGVALGNIRERLRMLFGEAAGVELGVEQERFVARMRIPAPAG